jgi:phage-related protein
LASGIAGGVAGIGVAIGNAIGGLFVTIGGHLTSFAGGIVGLIASVIVPAINGIQTAVGGIGSAISSLATTIEPVLGKIGSIFSGAFTSGYNFAKNTVVPFLMTDLPNALNGVVEAADSFVNSGWLTNPFSSMVNFITGPFWTTITETLPNAFISLATKLSGPVNSVQTAIGGMITSVIGNLSSLPGRISNALGTGINVLYNFGRNIISGIINGMRDMWSGLVNAVGQYIVDPLKKIPGLKFIIGSPSKWMKDEIGANIVKGIVQGLEENQILKDAASNLAAVVQDNLDISGIDFDALGKIKAEQFITSFRDALSIAANKDATLKSLLDIRVNQIEVNVNGDKKTIDSPSSAAAANTVTKILREAS